jgi:PadR family transcriptional regulator AphA
MSPMVRRSLTIEHAVLGLLQAGPLHGYQLHQQLGDPIGLSRVWRIKQAHLYALLERFEEESLISSILQPQEVRPTRRVYQLTENGRAAFQKWLYTPVKRPRGMRGEVQAKLYFIQSESSEKRAEFISTQRQVCQKWLAEQKAIVEQAGTTSPYIFLVNQFRAGQIQAMLDWLDMCQEMLK